MPYLKTLKIEGYKSVRDVTLELNRLNVLIGANGAGKTNLISVFRLLAEMMAGRLGLYVGRAGGANRLFHYGIKQTERIRVDLTFDMENGWENGYEAVWVHGDGDRLVFEGENYHFQEIREKDHRYIDLIDSGHTETRLPQQTSVLAQYVTDAIRGVRIYHFHDTSREAAVKQTGKLNDNDRLNDDASNLAAYLYFLREKHAPHYQDIVNTIRQAAPFFDDFVLRPDPLNPDTIRLEWREQASDEYFDAHALSDGTLRFMCLATLLLQPPTKRPALILIDEPELGLHPYAITLLAEMLYSAAQQKQVIISTQSVPLVNQFALEDVIVVDREDGASTFQRAESDKLADWLDSYGVGDLWEKNIIGGRPRPVGKP